MRLSRSLGLLIATFGLIVTANPVAADSRDIDQNFASFFPCLSGPHPPSFVPPSPGPGNDGAFPNICFVNWSGFGLPPGQAQWQASTGEWVLFRQPLGGPGSGCSLAGFTISAQLDGAPADFDVFCVQTPIGSFKSVRLLTHPLGAGTHTATLQVNASGPPLVFTQRVRVVQG